MKKYKIILPTKKFAKSQEEDTSINLNVESKENILRENQRNITIDVAELFNKERNESKKYKIYGKLKLIFDNTYSGTTSYDYLRNKLSLIGDGSDNDWSGYIPYNEFALLRTDTYRQQNTPLSGGTIYSFTQNNNTVGDTSHTYLTNTNAPYQNWNLYLSYVFNTDTNYRLTYTLKGNIVHSFLCNQGIPFIVSMDDNNLILTSPVDHGMKQGEYITLNGNLFLNTLPLSGRTFYINSVGNQTYNSEKFVLNISRAQLTPPLTFEDGSVVNGIRCLNINDIEKTSSVYYIHKHKILTTIENYIMDKVGFESPIWKDDRKILYQNFSGQTDVIVEKNRTESVYYDFKENFELTGITNNMGYTPTEIYLTTIFRNGNGYFDYPPKVGYKFNFHDDWIDQHFNGNLSIETGVTYSSFFRSNIEFKSGNTLNVGDELIGAFVEYNQQELNERIISESYHKINHSINIFNHNQNNPNVYSGSSNNNMVGLYYQPHYRIKLRELSPYVETSNTDNVYNLPENVKYFNDENVWKWRDIYDHGYIDEDGNGTNYPFINGMHYIKKDINLYLRNEKDYKNKKDGILDFNINPFDC